MLQELRLTVVEVFPNWIYLFRAAPHHTYGEEDNLVKVRERK